MYGTNRHHNGEHSGVYHCLDIREDNLTRNTTPAATRPGKPAEP
ncbi:rCG48639, isoform CRA_a [Rattus norvegicus]|uniref:RCG48639, isoform CRA_a n=1 Tax=Rattus norvegicus TaxID=10116 RepID=A6IFH0_RAT|nr:rCG48639, isoform CRA_a [Rattus norvegicus]